MSEKNHKFLRKLIRGALASQPDLVPQKETSYVPLVPTRRQKKAPYAVTLSDGTVVMTEVTVTTVTLLLDPECERAYNRKMKRRFQC